MAEQHREEIWPQTDEDVRRELPPGVKLLRTLHGHNHYVYNLTFDPKGTVLASSSRDNTVIIWDAANGRLLRKLTGHKNAVQTVAFNSTGSILASGDNDGRVNLWKTQDYELLRTFSEDDQKILCVAFDPRNRLFASCDASGRIIVRDTSDFKPIYSLQTTRITYCLAFHESGQVLVSAGNDQQVRIWNATTAKLIRVLSGHNGKIRSIAFEKTGRVFATGGNDCTIRIWDIAQGKLLFVLEGHTARVNALTFSPDGKLMVSSSRDQTLRFWRTETWETIAVVPEPTHVGPIIRGLSFHPTLPVLASVGAVQNSKKAEGAKLIHLWELDIDILLKNKPAAPAVHYVNAKVVLVGDTGVGKTGLSLVLNGQPYEKTDSTPGRQVWTFDSQEMKVGGNIRQTRETLLWDLAGQPGYRVIHQLHLNEVAVALVVFDARSETDPLAGVRHWERALRLAQQRQGTSGVPMKKFLVSARNDRGGVSIGEERLQAILKEFGFDGYFKTSAKEGWQIKELRAAIKEAIEWDNLPEVSSSQLFADIKSFLLEVKKTGRLLAPTSQLYDEFVHKYPDEKAKVANLRDQFETCIGRLENRDLIRRLTFGGYVLLQPELLDAYASAMVNAAKEEPDGLGSLAEEIALASKFYVPKEQKVTEPDQEQLLLHATVEELVRHDLALRENADDGRYLVFPSQFNRDYEDAPEPKGKAVAITFDGPVQSLYSTLAVRLGHSGLFTTGRAEMWRNAAVFTAKAGGKCGLFLHEFTEARGRLILFFNKDASPETRFHFEEFVLAHAGRHALEGTVELVRFFVCPDCGDPVPDSYVKRLREKGTMAFNCPCGGTVSLAEPKERIHFPSKVEAMDKSADTQRDFEAFVVSAKGETRTSSFQGWAGGDRVTLAIVFTDVVGSTALGEEIRDEAMNEVRRAHFAQSRRLISQFKGREIKTIGDSFMAAFKCVDAALDYAGVLQGNTGHPQVQVRAGIHIGPMQVEEGDVFGGTVNFAARVVGTIKNAEIWLSEPAKQDIDRLGAERHKHLKWERHEAVTMKGFPGVFTLWSLKE